MRLSVKNSISIRRNSTAFAVAQIFSNDLPKIPIDVIASRGHRCKVWLQVDGTARALRAMNGWEKLMLGVHIEKISKMAIVECEGRIVPHLGTAAT